MTAKGKVTTARLVPGESRIMVIDMGGGAAQPSPTKVKDAVAVTVVDMTKRRPMLGEYGRRPFWELTVRTDEGKELKVGYSVPQQTYWLAPDKEST
jgi:hypothetical protein